MTLVPKLMATRETDDADSKDWCRLLNSKKLIGPKIGLKFKGFDVFVVLA